MNYQSKKSFGLMAFLCLGLLAAPVGCSRSSKTTETTTVSGSPATGTVETQKTVTTEETSSSGGCSGVLGCTIHTVGVVIAYPFRLVGSLFEALF